jgi:hypothetical protein
MESQQMMELLLDMKARLDENAKTSLAMNEKIDTNTKATLATKEDMKTMQEKIQENLKRAMEEILNMNQAKTDRKLKEPTEPSPEMMQSVGEHQEVPREEAAVIPVRGRKRRHRGRK